VPFREPAWWYRKERGLAGRLLGPIGAIYGTIAARRLQQTPRTKSPVPLICVGNFTAGGTGKTPLALWIADKLRQQGLTPVFLTRGYGSNVRSPTFVDAQRHTAAEAGDEALLLARDGPVMVSPDRAAGAQAIIDLGIACDVIVMDDGLQNPALAKDFTIAVVDGARGFGNGLVIPAGPLRAPLVEQLSKADIVVVNGRPEDRQGIAAEIATGFAGPVLSAQVEPAEDIAWLDGARVVAFAGIGNPGRFFALLKALGATLLAQRTFADHHPFTDGEADALLAEARSLSALLVTTEKDFVRLGPIGPQGDVKRQARTVPIRLSFAPGDEALLMEQIISTIARR
jgi:tetraacyldisaccharide 4'-kinase